MKINVLFFGSLVDATGGETEVQLENVRDINAVKELLLENYPGLQRHTFRIALNQQLLEENQQLSNNDVVAFLPPFAGG